MKTVQWGLIALVVTVLATLGAEALFADETRARDAKSRDAVFVSAPSCVGDRVLCARQMYFNGDWHGVQLCRGKHCVDFDAIFGESR